QAHPGRGGVPGRQGLRPGLRCPAAQASHPEVGGGSAQRADPGGRVPAWRRDRGRCQPRAGPAGLPRTDQDRHLTRRARRHLRVPRLALAASFVLMPMLALPRVVEAQDQQPQSFPRVDSIAVEGNTRLSASQVTSRLGIVLGTEVTFRDVQRAIRALYATGQFDTVRVEQRDVPGKVTLVVVVTERPVLREWNVVGPEKI